MFLTQNYEVYHIYAYIVIYLAVHKAERLTGCEGIQFAMQTALKE